MKTLADKHIAKNIVVTLDFDGCIASAEKAKIFYTKKMFGKDVTPSQLTRETYPLGQENYKKLMYYVTTDGIMEFELLPNAKEVLHSLHKTGFRFAVVTGRHESPEHPELTACIKYCKRHALPVKYFHNTSENPKTVICSKLHSRAMIDDTLKKLLFLQNSNMALFYLQQPWNLHEKVDSVNNFGIFPINSWLEFRNGLLNMKMLHEKICLELGIENNWRNLEKIVQYQRKNNLL